MAGIINNKRLKPIKPMQGPLDEEMPQVPQHNPANPMARGTRLTPSGGGTPVPIQKPNPTMMASPPGQPAAGPSTSGAVRPDAVAQARAAAAAQALRPAEPGNMRGGPPDVRGGSEGQGGTGYSPGVSASGHPLERTMQGQYGMATGGGDDPASETAQTEQMMREQSRAQMQAARAARIASVQGQAGAQPGMQGQADALAGLMGQAGAQPGAGGEQAEAMEQQQAELEAAQMQEGFNSVRGGSQGEGGVGYQPPIGDSEVGVAKPRESLVAEASPLPSARQPAAQQERLQGGSQGAGGSGFQPPQDAVLRKPQVMERMQETGGRTKAAGANPTVAAQSGPMPVDGQNGVQAGAGGGTDATGQPKPEVAPSQTLGPAPGDEAASQQGQQDGLTGTNAGAASNYPLTKPMEVQGDLPGQGGTPDANVAGTKPQVAPSQTVGPAPGDEAASQTAQQDGSANPLARPQMSTPNVVNEQRPPANAAPPAPTGPGGYALNPAAGKGPPGSPTNPTSGAAQRQGDLAWTPTGGILDQVRQADVQGVDAQIYDAKELGEVEKATAEGYQGRGYDAQQAPDAVGYDAQGYDAEQVEAEQVKENVSQAASRIIGEDSEIMQRTQALAAQQANARGLMNSSMAVGAGRAAVLDKASELAAGDVQAGQFNAAQMNQMRAFNAEQKNAASAFLANAKNMSSQFLAAEKNQNGRFNAEQANQASAFTANAENMASQFSAAAKNTASMFNSGEANKAAMFSVEQANLASRFAAEMKQAAASFNAQAFNQASQRYTDAFNAALAAQNDAENLARRDTAQINAEKSMNTERVQGQMAAAAASAGATVRAAEIRAASDANALSAQREMQSERLSAERELQTERIGAELERHGLALDQRERESIRNFTSDQFNRYQSGLNVGMLTEMEPEARQNWLHNYNAVWSSTDYLPFDIDMEAFPPAG